MPRITPGNRLYIYQLLSREIGTGRQTLLSKVEEVFAADDLLPQDMGCSSVQEVLEQLDGIVKLTVFKKGNTYATLLQNGELDRALQQPDEPSAAMKAASKGKPWKHRAKARAVRPTKPRHQKVTPTDRPQEAETKPVPGPVEEGVATSQAEEPTQERPQVEANSQPTPEPEVTPEAETESVSVVTPAATPPTEVGPTEEPAVPIPEPEKPEEPETPEPQAPEPSIRFTVTYDPSQEEAPAEAGESVAPTPTATPQEVQAERVVELVSPAEEHPIAIEPLLVGLPEDFASQVRVPDGPLSLLYQLMPPDANPMELLEQDWQAARSTRSYEGTRSLVTFPLSLEHEDGTSVRATLRRSAKAIAGKHWTLSAIDGRDGTQPDDVEDAGPEGLQETSTAIERFLAHDVELGPWHEAFSALAQVAAPESWDLPGSPGSYDILRAYLALTYHAVKGQGLLATSTDGRLAAFATGLFSPLAQPVYACLEAGTNGFAWRLLGFSTTGEGALGEHLASLESQPQAPRYLKSLASLALPGDAHPDVPRRILRQLGEDGPELVEAALRRGAANYRLVAPAVDERTGETCLLVPLAARDGVTPSDALSIQRLEAKPPALRVTRILSLAEAYLEARVVSTGMPSWLKPPAISTAI